MKIKEISSKDTLSLRNEIFRPGKNISACIFDGDDALNTRHFGAFNENNHIVGIVSIYRNEGPLIKGENIYQLRAMATNTACRGQGVGGLLLTAAENYAKRQGAALVWANARSSAIGFYTKSGYGLASSEFIIDGIGPHFVVTKPLSSGKLKSGDAQYKN